MSKFHSWKEESRTNWGTKLEEGETLGREQIVAGAVLRIADAAEAMAKNYNRLIEDEKHWREVSHSRLATIRTMERQISALRGVITKMRKAKIVKVVMIGGGGGGGVSAGGGGSIKLTAPGGGGAPPRVAAKPSKK